MLWLRCVVCCVKNGLWLGCRNILLKCIKVWLGDGCIFLDVVVGRFFFVGGDIVFIYLGGD